MLCDFAAVASATHLPRFRLLSQDNNPSFSQINQSLCSSILGRGMKHNLSSDMTIAPVVGYRFHPTDYELVNHFLKQKIFGCDDNDSTITEIKVCDFEPWDLPDMVDTGSEDQVWYFFCPRDYKYSRSRRSNRTTRAGFWKPTGKPRKVKDKCSKKEIGTKRSLVFHVKDHPKPKRTKWIMHEYEYIVSNSTMAIQGNFLLCKLKAKPDEKINNGDCDLEIQNLNETKTNSSCDECEPSIHVGSDFGNLNESTTMSTYDKVEQNELTAFDFETGYVTTDSAGDEGESHYYLGFDQEDQNPNEMAAMSTYVNGKLICPITWDISACKEGERSIPEPRPSDILISSTAADVDNNAAEATQSEADLQAYFNMLEEEVLELKNVENFTSAFFSPMSPDGSSSKSTYSGFGSSEQTGVASEIGCPCP